MSQIFENIYLGSYADAKNRTFLGNLGITHIVTVGIELQTPYPQDFEYLHIPAYDNSSYKMSVYFDDIADFIHNAADRRLGRVLVHCHWGISRSAAALMTYLIKYHHMIPSQARNYIRQRRNNANPNDGFYQQLEEFANKLCVKFEKSNLGSFFNSPSNRGRSLKEFKMRSSSGFKGFKSPTKSFLPSTTFNGGFHSPQNSYRARPQTGSYSNRSASTKFNADRLLSPKLRTRSDVDNGDSSSRMSLEGKNGLAFGNRVTIKSRGTDGMGGINDLQYNLANYTSSLDVPSRTIVAYNSAIIKKDQDGVAGKKFSIQSKLNEQYENEKKCDDFFCAECGVKIFNSNGILHNSGKESAGTCNTMFLKYAPWLGDIKADLSKIYCPSSKCSTIIGFSNQRGGKCSCGKRIDRMYAIYPVRVTTTKKNRV